MSRIQTIERYNSCNCLDDSWIDNHFKNDPDKSMVFTENEGWFQVWELLTSIRKISDVAYSVVEWFTGGGSYHAYYMWICLHADGTPNKPKYTQLNCLRHFLYLIYFEKSSNRIFRHKRVDVFYN